MVEKEFRFDFAISYSGTDRETAKRLCDLLCDAGFRVFYDRDYEHEILGRNGLEYINHIYSSESQYCLVLISSEYDRREWTRLEREIIQAREIKGEQGRLIPLAIDGYHPSWLPATRIYYDLAKRTLNDLIPILSNLEGIKETSSRSSKTNFHTKIDRTPKIDKFACRFSDVSEFNEIDKNILAQIMEIGHRELDEFNIDENVKVLHKINPNCIHCWRTIKKPDSVVAFFILALISKKACEQIFEKEIRSAKQLNEAAFLNRSEGNCGIYIMSIVSTNRRYDGYLMKHIKEEINFLLTRNPDIDYIFTRPINNYVASLARKHGFRRIGDYPSPIYFTSREKIRFKGKFGYPYEFDVEG